MGRGAYRQGEDEAVCRSWRRLILAYNRFNPLAMLRHALGGLLQVLFTNLDLAAQALVLCT